MTTNDTSSNADTVHLSEAEVEQAKKIIEHIGPVLAAAEEMTMEALELCGRSEAAKYCYAAQELISKVGFYADTAARKLRAMPYKEPNDWLLPPGYGWAEEQQEAKS